MKGVKKILFVTGTDTGVGKTVLTAMLLAFLRERGGRVLAMKPFCSGAREDARLLHGLQRGCLTLDEVNPFYFEKPLAPAAAGQGRGQNMPLKAVLGKIHAAADRCDLLLVEGVGGVMVPLASDYTVRDLIGRLECKTIVVCPNRLGTINHTLLTANALQDAGIKEFTISMMGVKNPDISAASNPRMIRRMLPSTPVFCVPYLGNRAGTAGGVKRNVKYLKIMLAQLAGDDNLRIVLSQNDMRLRSESC
jgi:dethiobiotin synthetase